MKPDWIKVKPLSEQAFSGIKTIVKRYNLHTICQEALCPNINECWSAKTATFLLMGDVCTRNCKFCSVKTGKPNGFLDNKEPENIANAVKEMGLKYVVLTSVTRDDLIDGGAVHFGETVRKIKKFDKKIKVEALIPDNIDLNVLVKSSPDVIAHNIETVKELTPLIRDKKTDYDLSLRILSKIKKISPDTKTKSSLLLGFGETDRQIKSALQDLKTNGIDIVVLGQYLRPSKGQIPVTEYITPEKFSEYAKFCKETGITSVVSHPLARTSFMAHYLLQQVKS